MRNIVLINESNIKPELIGAKAWRLTQLFQAGFNVPKLFVITTQAFSLASFYLEEEILENFEKLNTPRVAVRSSATCEDRADSSFAGQFESYLAIPRGKLIETVKRCWASTGSVRVMSYATHHNILPPSIKMAVIVQEMIFAEKGGVIFTKNVFGGKPQNLIVEAAAGLGEKVVSGLVNPERIMVNKNTGRVIEKEIVEQGVLAEKEVKALTEIAIKIEEFYQAPQDIEWAIKDNKIYILQSRPITP